MRMRFFFLCFMYIAGTPYALHHYLYMMISKTQRISFQKWPFCLSETESTLLSKAQMNLPGLPLNKRACDAVFRVLI